MGVNNLRDRIVDLLHRYENGSLTAENAIQVVASLVLDGGTRETAPNKITSEPRIYRVDVGGRAWRATFAIQGKRYNRYFADATYGGLERSKEEAIRFASQVEAYEELRALENRFKIRKNTRSGIPGVARIDSKGQRAAFWVGYWTNPVDGKKKSKKFSTAIHGEQAARDLAIEYRDSSMKDLLEKYSEMLNDAKKFCLDPIFRQ